MKLLYECKALCPLLISLALTTPFVLAQDNKIANPKILVISREYTKPGKDGAPHQMVEGTYPTLLAANKIPNHYFALVSLSGPQRTLFIHGYSSFAEWISSQANTMSNQPVNASLDRANAADGDLLSSKDYSVWRYREDLSLNSGYRVGTRVEEISQFFIRPGHNKEWDEVVKLVKEGYRKGVPTAHWGTYEEAYGSPGGAFLVLVTYQSGAEMDEAEVESKQFVEAMGADGMKKLNELEAACVESRQTNLFFVDPKMSYPSEMMMKAEPDFWKSAK